MLNNIVIFEKSECHGRGLIATKDIPSGKQIHMTHVWSDTHNTWVNIKPNCMYNHSKIKENSEIKTINNTKILITSRDIFAAEELFVDFTKDKDLEQPEKDWKE
jgi:SET domain-containing protein|tara:strand:+ start:2146 stop:2457 length:312 start_codon:yes stop_codon:yes gene_type:complete